MRSSLNLPKLKKEHWIAFGLVTVAKVGFTILIIVILT